VNPSVHPSAIHPARIAVLHDIPPRPAPPARYVLYWMQASQRASHNPALEFAIEQANALRLPLLVCFGLMDDYPEANERHYAFLLQGLRDVESDLEDRGIRFLVKHGPAPAAAIHFANNAAILICDRGYTRHQKQWRDQVAAAVDCRLVQIEGDVILPVETASDHREFAARTIRPKIHRLWKEFLKPLPATKLTHPSISLKDRGDIDVSDPVQAIKKLKLDRSVKESKFFEGGAHAGRKRMKAFIRDHLTGYATGRREPAAARTSTLGAYLHFGNLSSLEIALAVADADAPQPDRDAYLEELIVRRELAVNYVHYCSDYDRYTGLPDWARKTLAQHRNDKREHLYTLPQLEAAQTADPYWNAAQNEMTKTGFMQNSMRMYWGKKILEWTSSPEKAFEIALMLNNKYFLCGRDPNAFANVAWLFGLHDRPWARRKIFGTIRYMNAAGLARKFDIDAYVQKIANLT
jgi:deoxyribodipyrimidine photo-lyase